jgi:DNA-binding NarL/FixJ family response regulator
MQASERQTEILGQLQKGLTNKEIGLQLGLSPNTVRDHISVLLRRNGLTGRAALATLHVRRMLAPAQTATGERRRIGDRRAVPRSALHSQ